MNQTYQQPVNQMPPQPKVRTRTSFSTVLFFLLLGTMIGITLTAFAAFSYPEIAIKLLSLLTPVSVPIPAPTTLPLPAVSTAPSPIAEIQWKTAKYGGFSYEYPAGWNAAEIWPADLRQGIAIVIDPNPISTAPRGGHLGTIVLRVINGQQNPQTVFEEEKSVFSSANYTDITTEQLQSGIGTIYHYKGKVAGEMLQGEIVENYYLTFETLPNDPLNQVVIVASSLTKNDLTISEKLKHIVLSIKKV